MQPRLFRSTRPSKAQSPGVGLVRPLRFAIASLLAVPLLAWPAVGVLGLYASTSRQIQFGMKILF